MNKEQKQAVVKEIGEELEGSSAVFAVDYRGISVPQAAELRGKLAEADATFNVVKNRLAKRITAESGAEALDEHLVGPTALTYVKGDAVIAAKAITDFIKEHEILAYKGGIMDGQPLDPDQFKSIARLPGLETLRGQLVGMTAAPLTGVVRGLNGLLSGLASQLGQMAEQGLVGQDAPAPAAEPEAKTAGDDDEPEAPDAGDPAGDDAPAVDAEPQTEEEKPAEEKSEASSQGEEPPTGEPTPDTAGEPETEAPADDAGESDNPGGDTDVTPDSPEATDGDEGGEDSGDGGDAGSGDESDDEADNDDNQED